MKKKLGFGCMRLPLLNRDDQESVDKEMFNRLVDTFLEKGFTYFDTALAYHNFKSEAFVQEALVKRHNRDEFQLATKLPPRMVKSGEDQERIFNEQLERCGVDYFDYYLFRLTISIGRTRGSSPGDAMKSPGSITCRSLSWSRARAGTWPLFLQKRRR